MDAGINYLNSSPNNALLQKFKADGVPIIIRLYWNQIERTRGSYSFSTYKNLFDTLESLGLKCGVVFWNQFQSGAELPSWWSGDPFRIVTNTQARQEWLNMMAWTTQQLSNYTCVTFLQSNNEPFYTTSVQRDGFIELFQLEYVTLKSVSDLPVASRFNIYNPAHGNFPDSVYDSFDVIGYDIYNNPDDPNGTVYNARWSDYRSLLADAQRIGKPFWITEFGCGVSATVSSLSEEQKRIWIKNALAVFAADGVEKAFAYCVRYDVGIGSSQPWNFWTGSRLISAYNELLPYDSGEPEPPKPPEPKPQMIKGHILNGAYTLYWDNGSVERWSQWIPLIQQHRNLFPELSVQVNLLGSGLGIGYDYAKFTRFLEIVDAAGLTPVIVTSQPDYGESQKMIGSDGYRNAVFNFLAVHGQDNRIKAFGLFQEPQTTFITGTPLQAAQWLAQLARDCLTRCSFSIIYPDLIMLYQANPQQRITDLKTTGIQNEPRVILDIGHYHYLKQYYPDKTPEQKAQDFYSDFQQTTQKINVSNAIVGETSVEYPTDATYEEGSRFIAKLNSLINVPFSFIATAGLRERFDCTVEALSGYIPPASDIQFTVQAGEGGTVEHPGINVYPLDTWQTFKATPNSGYAFDQWVLTGVGETVHDKYNSTVTLQMIREVDGATLTATFKEQTVPPKKYELSPLHSIIFKNTETTAYLCCQKLRNKIISDDLHEKLHPLI